MPTLTRWHQAWQGLNTPAAKISDSLYYEIIAKYTEPHRHYHTLHHLGECLEKLDELKPVAEKPAEIELALWFHDAIYDPLRHDNEALSAQWARTRILDAGLDFTIADRIYHLVMATRHTMLQPENTDEKVMIDADLAILGASPERFSEYERQIRQEYSFVPETIFRSKRGEILEKFYGQPSIFNTPLFMELYETQARINLKNALEQLCQL